MAALTTAPATGMFLFVSFARKETCLVAPGLPAVTERASGFGSQKAVSRTSLSAASLLSSFNFHVPFVTALSTEMVRNGCLASGVPAVFLPTTTPAESVKVADTFGGARKTTAAREP